MRMGGPEMYQIGDYIVKSANGVCKIEAITHLDMPGVDKNRSYYLLVPIADHSEKIYAPTDTIEKSARKVMSEEEAWDLIGRIPEVEEPWIENDKLRQAKYKEVMKDCDPQALVGIIKMMYQRKWKRMAQGKKNTVVDERYFRLAEDHLYSELGFALHKDKDEISSLIAQTIRKK
jgi:CarD family transcriptional regulator